MSERKVLTKYYPPDFDPAALGRVKKPKDATSKLQTVRLMAPFSLKCEKCGEYIYRGRKFNARKETTEEKYYNIPIIRFYIRCTRCSAELTFKTDPKNMDYTCEKGMKRNFEPWREARLAEETEEERLDRLEREEAEHDAMAELESKALDAKTEMAIADSLDQIRTRNARLERSDRAVEATVSSRDDGDEERERLEKEDAEAARLAFQTGTGEKIRRLQEDDDVAQADDTVVAAEPSTLAPESASVSAPDATAAQTPIPAFTRVKKKKKDFSAALGIKKKALV